jgi:hypothetical protein
MLQGFALAVVSNDVGWHRFSVARTHVSGALLLMPGDAPALVRAQRAGRYKRQHAPQVRMLTLELSRGEEVRSRRTTPRLGTEELGWVLLGGLQGRAASSGVGRARGLQTATRGRQRVGPPRGPLCFAGPYARETSGREGGNMWACGYRTGPA